MACSVNETVMVVTFVIGNNALKFAPNMVVKIERNF